ncbi:MAG: hypothetical protein WAW73_22705 [Rhodoferax sp.]
MAASIAAALALSGLADATSRAQHGAHAKLKTPQSGLTDAV